MAGLRHWVYHIWAARNFADGVAMSGWPEGVVDGFHAGGAVADPYECQSPGEGWGS